MFQPVRRIRPTSSTHSWYYTVSVSTGSTVDVIYCINSSGGQDSPGTVTTPWTSPTYSATISSSTPREAIVLASLPSGVAGTITATIYEDGKQVAQVTGTGSGALAEPTHVLSTITARRIVSLRLVLFSKEVVHICPGALERCAPAPRKIAEPARE